MYLFSYVLMFINIFVLYVVNWYNVKWSNLFVVFFPISKENIKQLTHLSKLSERKKYNSLARFVSLI